MWKYCPKPQGWLCLWMGVPRAQTYEYTWPLSRGKKQGSNVRQIIKIGANKASTGNDSGKEEHRALKMRSLNLKKTKKKRGWVSSSYPWSGHFPSEWLYTAWQNCEVNHISLLRYVFIICFKRVQSSPEKLHEFLETLKLPASHLQYFPHYNLKFQVPLLLYMGRSENIYFSATLPFETSVFRLSPFFLHHLLCSCALSLPFLPPASRPAASPL